MFSILIPTYNNFSDLTKKIERYSNDDALRQKITIKVIDKSFNLTIFAEFIINKIFNLIRNFF